MTKRSPSMTKLDPLIALFVQEVLQALRGATLDEISDLFSESARRPPAPRAATRPPEPRRRPGRPPTRVPAPPARGRTKPGKTTASEHPVVAEITDPEALLTAAANPTASPTPLTRAAGKSLDGGAALSNHATPSLRAGETLVRTSGSGTVIRRAKRK